MLSLDLDVVSRIYVVKYDCKTLYQDNFDNLNNYTNQVADDDAVDDDNAKKTMVDSCFYKPNKSCSKKKVVFKSNKYKYLGSIENFIDNCKQNNYRINNSNIDISYQNIESKYDDNYENLNDSLFLIEKLISNNTDHDLTYDYDVCQTSTNKSNDSDKNSNKSYVQDNSSDDIELSNIFDINIINNKNQIEEKNLSFRSFKKLISHKNL